MQGWILINGVDWKQFKFFIYGLFKSNLRVFQKKFIQYVISFGNTVMPALW